MTEKEMPQWYMMDSLFDAKAKLLVKIDEMEKAFVRGAINEHYVFRVDVPDENYTPEYMERLYGQLLEAAAQMGIDKEKVMIFPSNVDICQFVPCDDEMVEILEKAAEEQLESMKPPIDPSEAN